MTTTIVVSPFAVRVAVPFLPEPFCSVKLTVTVSPWA